MKGDEATSAANDTGAAQLCCANRGAVARAPIPGAPLVGRVARRFLTAYGGAVRRLAIGILFVAAFASLHPAGLAAPRSGDMPVPDFMAPKLRGDAVHDVPVFEQRQHAIGTIYMYLTNYGEIGFTSYPQWESMYISTAGAGMFFGCVRGLDTLVSEACDQRWPHYDWLTPEYISYEPIHESSHRRSSPHFEFGATADQQFSAVYNDTTQLPSVYGSTLDEIEIRRHRPIGIEVRQNSYAWSNPFCRRFILIDYKITNVTNRIIARPAIGFYSDPDIITSTERDDTVSKAQLDDISALLPIAPGIVRGTVDTINVAWVADNDGDPAYDFSWRPNSARAAIGTRILRAPGSEFSYNWFANNHSKIEWGPRRESNRWVYMNSQGAPFGDRARYRVMTNHEIDYGQVFTMVNKTAEGWQPPPSRSIGQELASGLDTRFILSYGPFADMLPGDSVFFTVAIVMGDGFHRNPHNFSDNFDYENPQPYLDGLNYQELINSARWADWVYDNPGVDTDGDGYRGPAYLVNCRGDNCDSVFYKGDGVPDFRGPGPPPAPVIDMTTQPGRVILRWNGAFTELERDPISRKRDFEGYRLYCSRFRLDDQFSMVASWDLVDYKRMAYSPAEELWVQESDPASEAEWKTIMGDSAFSVFDYPAAEFTRAYQDTVQDTFFSLTGDILDIQERTRYSYWTAEDWNRNNEYYQGEFWEANIIQQIETRDTLIGTQPFKYGVYEATIENLNPAVPLFFAVTTFDFGDYSKGMEPLEMAPSENYHDAHPIYSSDVVVDSGLRVSVYPNPYRVLYRDGAGNLTTYYREGYEGRGIHKFEEQDRRIHFVNLPDTATIRIFSLDGDLIRTINHPDPFLTTYSSEVGWDLVSRNVQAVVSGIYIWRVDSRLGTQMGKLVIIK